MSLTSLVAFLLEESLASMTSCICTLFIELIFIAFLELLLKQLEFVYAYIAVGFRSRCCNVR